MTYTCTEEDGYITTAEELRLLNEKESKQFADDFYRPAQYNHWQRKPCYWEWFFIMLFLVAAWWGIFRTGAAIAAFLGK